MCLKRDRQRKNVEQIEMNASAHLCHLECPNKSASLKAAIIQRARAHHAFDTDFQDMWMR